MIEICFEETPDHCFDSVVTGTCFVEEVLGDCFDSVEIGNCFAD